MNMRLNSIQLILLGFALVFMALLIPLFFIKPSWPVTNIVGYTAMLLLGTWMIYTGYLMSKRLENGKVLWYKQPFVIAGVLTYILIIVFWISNTFSGTR